MQIWVSGGICVYKIYLPYTYIHGRTDEGYTTAGQPTNRATKQPATGVGFAAVAPSGCRVRDALLDRFIPA